MWPDLFPFIDLFPFTFGWGKGSDYLTIEFLCFSIHGYYGVLITDDKQNGSVNNHNRRLITQYRIYCSKTHEDKQPMNG